MVFLKNHPQLLEIIWDEWTTKWRVPGRLLDLSGWGLVHCRVHMSVREHRPYLREHRPYLREHRPYHLTEIGSVGLHPHSASDSTTEEKDRVGEVYPPSQLERTPQILLSMVDTVEWKRERVHPPPAQAGLILPSWWNIPRKWPLSVYLYSLLCGFNPSPCKLGYLVHPSLLI